MIHWGTWLGCTSVITLIAYCIASGIPAFGGLVSLVGAVFGTLLCFLPMPCMWFYDNWNTKERTTWWRCLVRLCFCHRSVSYGCWNIWICCGSHQHFRRGWKHRCMVMRGQLKLSLESRTAANLKTSA